MEIISIIIPTLNEEDHLPILLDSIKKQNFKNYEIIISDAGSTDRTIEIAKKYNCIIIKGGLPAKGRNEGAKIAKGDILLFLDADNFIKDNFINTALKEFKEKMLDFSSFRVLPEKGFFASLIFNIYYNYPIILLEKILPHSATGILVKKRIFEELNGFDETIYLAEDHDLGRRAAKISKFGIIRSVFIFTSTRRLKKDGWFMTFFRYTLCEIYMIFIGPVKKDIFKYRFNHYKEKDEFFKNNK